MFDTKLKYWRSGPVSPLAFRGSFAVPSLDQASMMILGGRGIQVQKCVFHFYWNPVGNCWEWKLLDVRIPVHGRKDIVAMLVPLTTTECRKI